MSGNGSVTPAYIPTDDELNALLGEPLYNEKYEMDILRNKGFGDWVFELILIFR